MVGLQLRSCRCLPAGSRRCLADRTASGVMVVRRQRCPLQTRSVPLRRCVTRASSETETAESQGVIAPPAAAEVGMGVPEYPVAPPPAVAAPAVGGGFPWWAWIAVGVVVAKCSGFVMRLLQGGNIKQNAQQMMMEKMMQQMMSGKGAPGMPGMGGGAGANPFANMGAGQGENPFGGGANPFANMQGSQQGQQASSPWGSPNSSGFPASGGFPASPAYDAQGTPAATQPPDSQKASEQKTSPTASSPSSSSTSAASPSMAPSTSTASTEAAAKPAQQQTSPRKKAAFVDVDDEAEQQSASTSAPPREPEVMPGGQGGYPGGFPGGFPGQGTAGTQAGGAQADANGSGAGGGAAGGGKGRSNVVLMLERMMEDENLQKMMYPYLPEPMQNPETFKWMLSNPEYRAQLETMLEKQQGSNPMMEEMLSNFDPSNPELTQQLDAIGMTPNEVLQKIMADPELAMAFSKPEVQAAIMDVTQNQMNIGKYTGNPEIMAVFNKMSSMFMPGGAPGGAPGGDMPGAN